MPTALSTRLAGLLSITALIVASGCSGPDGGVAGFGDQAVELDGKTYHVGDTITYEGDPGEYCGSVEKEGGTPDYPQFSRYAVLLTRIPDAVVPQGCDLTIEWFKSFLESGEMAESQAFNGVIIYIKKYAWEAKSNGFWFYPESVDHSNPYSGVFGLAFGY